MDKPFIAEAERLEEMANGTFTAPESLNAVRKKTQLNRVMIKKLKVKLNR